MTSHAKTTNNWFKKCNFDSIIFIVSRLAFLFERRV